MSFEYQNPSFDILVVALDREVERRQHIQTMMQDLGADYHFWDATDGRDVAQISAIKDYDPAKAMAMIGRELRASELACYESHRRIWRHAITTQRSVLVLESDVQINKETLDVCQALCNGIMPEKGLVMINYHECIPSFWGRRPVLGKYQLVRFANKQVFYTSAYLLSPKVAELLLQYSEPLCLPVDNYMTGGHINKGVDAYAVYPRVGELSELAEMSGIQAADGRRTRERSSRMKKASRSMRNFWRSLRKPVTWR